MRKTRSYLLTLHLHPSANKKEREAVEQTVRSWTEKHDGEIKHLQYEEKCRLAYEIGHTGQITKMEATVSMPACSMEELQRQLQRDKKMLRFRVTSTSLQPKKKTLREALAKQQEAPVSRVPKEKASIEELDEKIDEILEEKIL